MFQCKCGKTFKDKRGLTTHQTRWCDLCADLCKYKCVCGETFQYLRGKNSLRKHRKQCPQWKKDKHKRMSENSKKSFQKMLKDDPDRVKRIREKAGKKISNTILSNDAERKRRAKVLASLNKTEDFRRRTSETATQTSTRPEIIAQRSKQLAVWRENNPELCKEIIIKLQEGGKKWRKDHPQEFYDKCIKPMLNSWKSKPETVLFNFCKDIDDGFNNTSFVKHSSFTTKTNSRQIDIFHSHKNIIVEFDGPLHFDDIFGEEDFAMKQQRDRQLNALSDVYCIIRVSYEHYNRKRECFDSDILDNIRQIIISPKVGLYLFGELYGKN